MQPDYQNTLNFLTSWQENDEYFEMLSLMASISRLFSDSEIPYLDYRLAENLFCKYYHAVNDARSCTAFDARLKQLGIGIKTFILNNNESVEKIAEFNKLRPKLTDLKGVDLARQLGIFRNERMKFSCRNYNVNNSLYHIVGRSKALLRIFNCPYEYVDIENICDVKDTSAGICFNDGKNEYRFNASKSVLMKRFEVPVKFHDVVVDIKDDPLSLFEFLFKEKRGFAKVKQKGIDYVVLPLYSTRTQDVPVKSGLNQWNAGGRPRDPNEVYIPVPRKIHSTYPDFFPPRDEPFVLELPNGEALSAKICQDNGKALMSNPNNALGEWILRKILRKKEGSLVTKFDLDVLGVDSVVICKKVNQSTDEKLYSIQFSNNYESYNSFLK